MANPPNTQGRGARPIERITVLCFLALLCLPGVRLLISGDQAASVVRENRSPPQRPALELARWRSFPARFESWFRDAVPFRAPLLELHACTLWTLLRQSPSARMLRGRDGWLFSRDLSALPVYLGARPFSEAELETWRVALEQRRDWLARRGIEYVFAVAPDKSSIYPERLPARLGPGGETRLDQLLAHLGRTSSVKFIDLRPALLAAKAFDTEADHVYFPHGTHWTDRGAYAAYRALLPMLGPAFEPLTPLQPVQQRSSARDAPSDSWARRLYLDACITQREARLQCHAEEPFRHDPPNWRTGVAGHSLQPASALPSLVVVHDSFGVEVRRWLAHHSSRLTWRWQIDLDLALIEAEAPDAVLQIHGESMLTVALELGNSPGHTRALVPELLEPLLGGQAR